MIYVKTYTNAQKEIWNNFNQNAKNGLFMFDRNYMEYHSERFKDASLLFYDDSKLLALLPLNIVENTLYSHQGLSFGGFISDYSMKQHKMIACFNVLKKYMQEKCIEKLIYKATPYIYHKIPAQEDLYALFLNNAQPYRTDCSSVITLNMQHPLTKGRKAQIKRAKREGVVIKQSTNFKDFLTLLNEVLSIRHHTKAVHNLNELQLLYSRFPNAIKLWEATSNNQIIAGALIFVYENLIHTQYLAANDYAKEIGALDLLLFTLIQHYMNTKTYLSFGISTIQEGKVLNEGLITQKESFGARSVIHNFYELHAIKNGGGGKYLYIFFSILFSCISIRRKK